MTVVGLVQIRMSNVAFAVFFIATGLIGLGAENPQFKYNGPPLPWWGAYVFIACGCIMLCMELWAARTRR
jgi:hypothetical protein